ncbi:MAG: hypothetical protein PHG58_08965 [Clostridia bacterium]|nr:hypothetical protein [Clostridia bacterium]
MKRNKNTLGKMMTEFSQDLGMSAPKTSKVGRNMLLAAGGIAGYALIRGMINRMK